MMKYGFCVNGESIFSATTGSSCYEKWVSNFPVNYAAETFINIAKPFIGYLLERVEIYGTRSEKWKPKLLKTIPANQLPPKYGGSEDWKPVSLK